MRTIRPTRLAHSNPVDACKTGAIASSIADTGGNSSKRSHEELLLSYSH
jgi:hypothetical protein